ncbi:MAG: hypothetical protein GY820_38460 [Gammaproteobacteria bacterium]|nr:hypothetical protein [Gammaproteobacteria bacterium]
MTRDGDGTFVIKKTYGILATILLVVTTTISIVMAVSIAPLESRVDDIEIWQDDDYVIDHDELVHDIHELEKHEAVHDVQYKSILAAIQEIKDEINKSGD